MTPINTKGLLPPGYTARHVPGDEVTDAGIEIYLHGVETQWSIQIGCGYAIVNRWEYRDGEPYAMHHQPVDRSAAAAMRRLAALLRVEG